MSADNTTFPAAGVPAIDALVEGHVSARRPGAAVAMLVDNEVVHARGYGFANLAERIPMAPTTAFRICSVTKQFTCTLVRMLAHEGHIDLDASARRYLPELHPCTDALSVRQLAQNVSGLRDYWCLAMLTGAGAETPFRRADAERLLFAQPDFQFPPGTAYSYNNGNFTLLGWIVEAITGRRYPDVLHDRILGPLGMTSTFVPFNTGAPLPDGALGYEPVDPHAVDGAVMPAVVDIHWEGDAGIVSTLDDLIRWERNFVLDALAPAGSVEALFEVPSFPGGARGGYGLGLRVGEYRGYPHQGHEGGLRGWRMCRLRFPSERLSVIVLLNHLADAGALARRIADIYLPGKGPAARRAAPARPERLGFYLDGTTGKGFEVGERDGQLTLNAMGTVAPLRADGEYSYVTDGGLRLSFLPGAAEHAEIRSTVLNYAATLHRVTPDAAPDLDRYVGAFHNHWLAATLTLQVTDGALTLHIDGPLGAATAWPVRVAARDLLVMTCQRALDYQPPGEFVLWLTRDATGAATAVTVSCTLAYGMRFSRTPDPD